MQQALPECAWSQAIDLTPNQAWDSVEQEVVSGQEKRAGARLIHTAVFDAQGNRTILQLKGVSPPVEIEL